MSVFKIILKLYGFCTELLAGFRATSGLGRIVTIFGSARLHPGQPDYEAAVEVAKQVAEAGYSVLTGGGPGIMAAANKGAALAGATSVGCSIILPMEQSSNPFIGKGREAKFKRFFLRKFIMVRSADAFVIFPGGYGTLDEAFEVLTLIQCRKQEKPVRIVLYNSAFWGGLVDWLRNTMYKGYHTISGEDLFLFSMADTPAEAVAIACGDEQAEMPAIELQTT
ncbi:MAG: TIGR00730 family Rossman fold protein [Dissulfurispiraceae bacterium]